MNAPEILYTQVCRQLGLHYPICQAGMGFVAPGRLAAAVSAAGVLTVAEENARAAGKVLDGDLEAVCRGWSPQFRSQPAPPPSC